jgi:hypothetical protein
MLELVKFHVKVVRRLFGVVLIGSQLGAQLFLSLNISPPCARGIL